MKKTMKPAPKATAKPMPSEPSKRPDKSHHLGKWLHPAKRK